jgi:molybdate/tungstate transport system ATP-binding protein
LLWFLLADCLFTASTGSGEKVIYGDIVIFIENLGIKLGKFRLHGINLAIDENEYMVLLGPTGAGKTVLVECILGIQRPQTGRVIVDGQDVTALYPEERNIGYVPQDYMLFPNMTVEKNLAYGLKARNRPMAEIKGGTRAMMALLGIKHLRSRLPLNLSGGERQRVALGRALITEPKILLLDEPLSALDENLRYELSLELRRVHTDIGGTFLHVCHNLEEAAYVGDRWAIMDDGHIVQVGNQEDILAHPVNEFVARFTRTRNVFKARSERDGARSYVILPGENRLYTACNTVGEVTVAIRPESISILRTDENPGGNVLSGKIVRIASKTIDQELQVDVGMPLTVLEAHTNGEDRFKIGQTIRLYIPEDRIHLMPTGENKQTF